jgi:predicted cobalt transporter CbtA
VGAPQPAGESSVPAEIAGRFATASLAANAVFWLVLGAATGAAYGRFER